MNENRYTEHYSPLDRMGRFLTHITSGLVSSLWLEELF